MKTILFVDDDRIYRELCRRVFEEEGYRVFSAENGAQALSIVASQHPDVAVLDVRMPEMNGFDLADEISKLLPELPLIFYTGCDDMCAVDHRVQLAAACVDKNRGFTELAMVIGRVLSQAGQPDSFRLGVPPQSASVA
jgi:CheY-like chemotaxis protein